MSMRTATFARVLPAPAARPASVALLPLPLTVSVAHLLAKSVPLALLPTHRVFRTTLALAHRALPALRPRLDPTTRSLTMQLVSRAAPTPRAQLVLRLLATSLPVPSPASRMPLLHPLALAQLELAPRPSDLPLPWVALEVGAVATASGASHPLDSALKPASGAKLTLQGA